MNDEVLTVVGNFVIGVKVLIGFSVKVVDLSGDPVEKGDNAEIGGITELGATATDVGI